MSNCVETMMYVREKPWHGLGTMVAEAPTSADAMRLAGLNWEVNPLPIYTAEGVEIPNYKANTRSSDGTVLGIVSNRYKIVQNGEAFDFTDALLGEGIRYETAGSLNGGKRIWLLGKMPERYIAGDKFEPYICFTNTHDGSGAVRVCMTPIRVVCNNTLNMALGSAKRNWSAVHKGNIGAKLEEARTTLQLADVYLKGLEEKADRLANAKMSYDETVKAIETVLPILPNATDRQKETVKTARDSIMACVFAPDLEQFLYTKWGLINAVSDYIGHSAPIRRNDNYDENRWGKIIGGHPLLDKVVDLVA